MQVAIFSKVYKPKDHAAIEMLIQALHAEDITSYWYKPFFEDIKNKFTFPRDVGLFENHLDFGHVYKKFDTTFMTIENLVYSNGSPLTTSLVLPELAVQMVKQRLNPAPNPNKVITKATASA